MPESQKHGFDFEQWIKENSLKEIYQIPLKKMKYINDWDIPPVSIKSFKYEVENPSIEFGSIKRVFNNQSSYILVLIGYKQKNNIKIPVFSDVIYIQQSEIIKLKGDLNFNIILKLCEEIKKYKQGDHEKARDWAKKQKNKYNDKTLYDIRFKIDSKNQRRIQCSLKLKDIYNTLNQNLVIRNYLNIPELISNPRK